LHHIYRECRLKHLGNSFSGKKKAVPRWWCRLHHNRRKSGYFHHLQWLFQFFQLTCPYLSSKKDRAGFPNSGGRIFRLRQKFQYHAAPKEKLLLVLLLMLLKVKPLFRDRVLVLLSSAFL